MHMVQRHRNVIWLVVLHSPALHDHKTPSPFMALAQHEHRVFVPPCLVIARNLYDTSARNPGIRVLVPQGIAAQLQSIRIRQPVG
jgi:hypothetical protein